MRASTLIVTAGLLSLVGCAGLPDVERGELALQQGRAADAEKDLKPLAERGYLRAQTGLGRAYTDRSSPETNAQAVYWYRRAAAQDPRAEVALARSLSRGGADDDLLESQRIARQAWETRQDPNALAALIELYSDYPELDTHNEAQGLVQRAEAAKDWQTEAAVIDWYRSTPQMPGHPQQLVQRCTAAIERVPQCYVDLLRDARTRGDSSALAKWSSAIEREYAAGHLLPAQAADAARALVTVSDGPQAAQPDTANRLVAALIKGDVTARVEAAGVVVEYPYLAQGFDVESALKAGVAAHQADASLYLGRLYLARERVPADPTAAEHYLTEATAQADTRVVAHYFLGRLYQFGYLDETQPERALPHLLYAARHGYAPADTALAELYYNGAGAKPEPVQAWLFAQLAHAGGEQLAVEQFDQPIPADDLGHYDNQRWWRLISGGQIAEQQQRAQTPPAEPTQARVEVHAGLPELPADAAGYAQALLASERAARPRYHKRSLTRALAPADEPGAS